MISKIPDPAAGGSIIDWARPVTDTLNGLSDHVGAPFRNERNRRGAAANSRHWVFSCTIDENDERTGGWKNAQLQIGYNCNVKDSSITGLDQTADGVYWAEVNLLTETAVLKHTVGEGEEGPTSIPDHDFRQNKINIYIGTVVDGVQTDGIYCIPVAYKYL